MRGRAQRRRGGVAPALLAVTIVLGLAAAGCSGDDDEPEPPEPIIPAKLTLGVYGQPSEIAAYRDIAEEWNEENPGFEVTLETSDDRDQQIADLQSDGKETPDLFTVSRRDFAYVLANGINQPVGDLLDERGVSFGDEYSRDAILSFSADDELQCMPYSVSPMMIYYNTRLVDFDEMARRGLEIPDFDSPRVGWTFDQFAKAARFAARPAPGAKGFALDPDLRSIGAFVLAAGGQLFDDPTDPTSLAFSSPESRAALDAVLPVLLDPAISLTPEQRREKSPAEWFEDGKLGMVAGFRELTPRFREAKGLDFDVMPMPVISDRVTLGDTAGLCLSSTAKDPDAAADLMAYLLSEDSLGQVSRAGYIVPANLGVANSEDFLQPGREPRHASRFNENIRYVSQLPLLTTYPELSKALSGDFTRMLNTGGVLYLRRLTAQIDEKSRTVLAPDVEPEGSDSASPSGE